MNTKDIRNGLKARLAGVSPLPPVAWPNSSLPEGTLPRVQVSFASVETDGGTLKGNEIHRETAIMNALVIIEQNAEGGENEALDHADAIAAQFPEGLRLSITGGRIVIRSRPSVRDGYSTDTDYRVPVIIRYQADATS